MTVTAIRTVIIYILLILAMRLMGKRQIGDLQHIELVVTLLISDLAVVPMQDPGTPLMSGLLPIFLLVALEILLSAWMLKSPSFARLVTGNPIVVIQNGTLLPSAMKKLRLTVNDLTENLRGQGIFDLSDVDTAIVETDGTISTYLRTERQPARRRDVTSKTVPPEPVPMVIISDGRPCEWAMDVCGWDHDRLNQTLQRDGITQDNVFLMTADAMGNYTIVPKGDGK